MFQSFEDIVDEPDVGGARLAALRAELERRGLDGFLVPHADEHQSESLPLCAERLRWLTGFHGSAGYAIVLKQRAAIFVDGRYSLQVRDQVDMNVYEARHLLDEPPHKWLETALTFGDRLGYDPKLTTVNAARTLEDICASVGARLVPCDINPLDTIWSDRPAAPLGPVVLHPLRLSGESTESKLERLRAKLGASGADAIVLTQLDSIAWLFNIRGSDIAHSPLALGYAVVFRGQDTSPQLFMAGRKLLNEARGELALIAELLEPERLEEALGKLRVQDMTVRIDPASTNQWIQHRLSGGHARIQHGPNPCDLMKARKNATEISGARTAHLRDGVAMVRFLAWLDREVPKGHVDEITAAAKLEAMRRETGKLKDISFDTIAGVGANGAIVHYRVTRATNKLLRGNTLFLIDSGGQYEDGTTDVTRTVAIGKPNDELRDRFTRVLKGHIALTLAHFPEGTTGAQLDPFARRWLWEAGLDYDHGTGHGVGSYLCVHEGPARIAKVPTVALEPGMILSNEPGYYKSGQYGIRIENLILVRPPADVEGGERKLLSFETLTFAPIDRRLIAPGLMTPQEIQWLDAYHDRVLEEISPFLDTGDQEWLEAATGPLK